MELTKSEKEDIGAKIDNEGFGYYFIYYGANKKLEELIGKEIKAYRDAHYALVGALRANGIDIPE